MKYNTKIRISNRDNSVQEILYILREGEGEIELHLRGNEGGGAYWFRYSDRKLEKLYEGYDARPDRVMHASEEELRELLTTRQVYYEDVNKSIFEDTIR